MITTYIGIHCTHYMFIHVHVHNYANKLMLNAYKHELLAQDGGMAVLPYTYMYIHVLMMRDEKSKQGQTNNKAKQHVHVYCAGRNTRAREAKQHVHVYCAGRNTRARECLTRLTRTRGACTCGHDGPRHDQ